MLEKEIEQSLVRSVKKMGGRCLKFTCPGLDGVPDRLVLLPKGKCAFVELKAPDKKPRALQIKRMKQLTYHHIRPKSKGGKATVENRRFAIS